MTERSFFYPLATCQRLSQMRPGQNSLMAGISSAAAQLAPPINAEGRLDVLLSTWHKL